MIQTMWKLWTKSSMLEHRKTTRRMRETQKSIITFVDVKLLAPSRATKEGWRRLYNTSCIVKSLSFDIDRERQRKEQNVQYVFVINCFLSDSYVFYFRRCSIFICLYFIVRSAYNEFQCRLHWIQIKTLKNIERD